MLYLDACRSVKLKYSEDIDKSCADQQTTRSSRMIYVLNQQVKDIQGDIDKMQGQQVTAAKKVWAKSHTWINNQIVWKRSYLFRNDSHSFKMSSKI